MDVGSLKNQKHRRHRHKLGLSGRWLEVVVLVAAVYLSSLALCTSWKPSWEAPAQSSIEGRMDFGSLKNKNTWEAPAQIWIEWKMDRSGVSCGSGILAHVWNYKKNTVCESDNGALDLQNICFSDVKKNEKYGL